VSDTSPSVDAVTVYHAIPTVLPTLSPVTIVSNNATTSLAKVGNVVTLSFTASEPLLTNPAVTVAGQTASVNHTSGDSYTATYTLQNSDATGVVPFTINFSDAAGNAGTQVTSTTNSSSITFDKTSPTVTVDTKTTTDTTPSLSGTLDDSTASVSVTVDSTPYAATNNGDGTWSISDNALAALAMGTYDVTATATDSAGNTSSDSTSAELTVEAESALVTTAEEVDNETDEEDNKRSSKKSIASLPALRTTYTSEAEPNCDNSDEIWDGTHCITTQIPSVEITRNGNIVAVNPTGPSGEKTSVLNHIFTSALEKLEGFIEQITESLKKIFSIF
jgi:hypothetical protein